MCYWCVFLAEENNFKVTSLPDAGVKGKACGAAGTVASTSTSFSSPTVQMLPWSAMSSVTYLKPHTVQSVYHRDFFPIKNN